MEFVLAEAGLDFSLAEGLKAVERNPFDRLDLFWVEREIIVFSCAVGKVEEGDFVADAVSAKKLKLLRDERDADFFLSFAESGG